MPSKCIKLYFSRKKIFVPTLLKMFRPVTRNTLIFLFGLDITLNIHYILPFHYFMVANIIIDEKPKLISAKNQECISLGSSDFTPFAITCCCIKYRNEFIHFKNLPPIPYLLLRGYIFQKLLLAWKFSCINKNCFFVKETDTFGHIAVWTTYTSHINHFTPQHTAFEQSAGRLSVFLELLPGSIRLTMLWHAGWTLEKTFCMNMTYNYSTTIFRSILTQILFFSGIIYNFSIWPWKIHKQKFKIHSFLPEMCTFWAKILLNIVVQ